MGSGGMIVMDERTCMVDVARYFIDFLSDESCGNVSHAEGLKQDKRCCTTSRAAREKRRDELLKDMGTSGRDGPCASENRRNPVFHAPLFPEEYAEHEDGYCRAGVCRGSCGLDR